MMEFQETEVDRRTKKKREDEAMRKMLKQLSPWEMLKYMKNKAENTLLEVAAQAKAGVNAVGNLAGNLISVNNKDDDDDDDEDDAGLNL